MGKEIASEEKRLRVLAVVEGAAPAGGKEPARERFVWPDLVFKELLAAVGIIVVLIIWALLMDAPLRAEADPSWTENPAKAPWYFVGLQELLVYFDPWLAGVVMPTLIVLGLMAVPYIDIYNPVSGRYGLSRRKKACAIFLFGFFLWFGLIIVGTFFRGPSWHFYWPWESWLVEKPAGEALRSLPAIVGAAFLGLYYISGMMLPPILDKRLLKRFGSIRYMITVFLLLTMLLVPIKILLRLVFGIKYVLITPFFNI
ncbi:MAG: hypothetical protein PVH87_09020 [Desulfobacteraceae bacterium]